MKSILQCLTDKPCACWTHPAYHCNHHLLSPPPVPVNMLALTHMSRGNGKLCHQLEQQMGSRFGYAGAGAGRGQKWWVSLE